MKLGASFSHPHLSCLELDPDNAIKEFKSLGLEWIRLGCYWNEIEKIKGKYNFSQIDPLVEYCEKNKIKVVMTVGMKAPRWPEYYIPDWVNFNKRRFTKISSDDSVLYKHTLEFVEKCVKHFQNSSIIKVWQVENEPLDPTGEKVWRIDYQFLKDETELIRKLQPDKKVLINTWGNLLTFRKVYRNAAKISDIVAFDIYLRHPPFLINKIKKYAGPTDTKSTFKKVFEELRSLGKEVWLAELQAEPWEKDELVAKSDNPPSFLPEHFERNIGYTKDLEPDVILLWGFEYWLWRKEKFNDERYWIGAKRIINE